MNAGADLYVYVRGRGGSCCMDLALLPMPLFSRSSQGLVRSVYRLGTRAPLSLCVVAPPCGEQETVRRVDTAVGAKEPAIGF